MFWTVVALIGGALLLARDYRKQVSVVSWHSFRWWIGQVGGVVVAGALAFGWLWLVVRWLSR